MGRVVTELDHHERIGLDTPVFIYRIAENTSWSEDSLELLRATSDGQFSGVTSILTTMELSVKPIRLGRPEVAAAYEFLIRAIPHLAVVDLDARIGRVGADLRARHGIRTPDALQIAASIAHGATAFVTNDKRLRRVDEVEIVILDDYV